MPQRILDGHTRWSKWFPSSEECLTLFFVVFFLFTFPVFFLFEIMEDVTEWTLIGDVRIPLWKYPVLPILILFSVRIGEEEICRAHAYLLRSILLAKPDFPRELEVGISCLTAVAWNYVTVLTGNFVSTPLNVLIYSLSDIYYILDTSCILQRQWLWLKLFWSSESVITSTQLR